MLVYMELSSSSVLMLMYRQPGEGGLGVYNVPGHLPPLSSQHLLQHSVQMECVREEIHPQSRLPSILFFSFLQHYQGCS